MGELPHRDSFCIVAVLSQVRTAINYRIDIKVRERTQWLVVIVAVLDHRTFTK